MLPPHAAPGRSQGFTLIELLLVLSIVGVLAVMGVVYFQDRQTPAIEGTLNEVGGFLVAARNTARSTGKQVVITPSGSGRTFTMTYALTNGPSGTYDHSTQGINNMYSSVVTDAGTEPTASALSSLQSALQATQIDTTSGNVFTAGIWSTNLCSTGLTFKSNGTATAEGFVAIGPAATAPNAPVGVILVTSTGNMLRYYRSSPSSSWVRK
jgi:MSHA pilin protein MshA